VAAPCCRSGRLFHGSGPAQRAASRRARKPFLTCTCSKRGAAQFCVRKALLALVGRLDGIGWASSRDVLIRDYTGFPMRCHGARCASAERLGNQRTRPLTEVAQSDIATNAREGDAYSDVRFGLGCGTRRFFHLTKLYFLVTAFFCDIGVVGQLDSMAMILNARTHSCRIGVLSKCTHVCVYSPSEFFFLWLSRGRRWTIKITMILHVRS